MVSAPPAVVLLTVRVHAPVLDTGPFRVTAPPPDPRFTSRVTRNCPASIRTWPVNPPAPVLSLSARMTRPAPALMNAPGPLSALFVLKGDPARVRSAVVVA